MSSPVFNRAPLLLGLGFAALAAAAGCAGKDDVDRSQPDKLNKALFFNDDGSARKFYYRWTITDIPPTSGWAFEGIQGSMDKITFAITENELIGYRAYDYAPGTQNDITGAANNKDAPIISFKIKSHFDVKREYNPGTGEESNVISENTTDRDWSAREYMRVDWSTDKLANPLVDVTLSPPSEIGLPSPVNVSNAAISEVEITNPGRAIYSKDYLDVTVQTQATPDYEACMKLAAPDDGGPWGCGPAKISLRHSFVAVKDSEYEPLDYPDRQLLLGANGKPMSVIWGNDGRPHACDSSTLSQTGGTFSGADCAQVGADQFSKFGFFRTVRQTYDRRLGATEVARKYLANRWNIWKETIERKNDGTPVLMADGTPVRKQPENRAPREIPYYLNVEFPDDDPMLLDAAKGVVAEWNDAMKRTVAALRATATGGGVADEADVIAAANARGADGTPKIPDIFVLKENSCNVANVQRYLTAHPDMASELEARTASVTPAINPDQITKKTLVPVCTALEALTQSLPEGDAKKFSWQRNGDLRYSFVYWVDRPQGSSSAPLGYGPSSADPETGEIVSATLYLYGASLDVYSQFAADSVDMLNGKLSSDDLLSGKRFSDVLKETAVNRQQRDAIVVTPEARAYAHALASSGGVPGVRPSASAAGLPPSNTGAGATARLVKVDPFAVDTKLAALKGTPLETQMMTQDILAAFVPGYIPGRTNITDIDPQLLAKASPVRWMSESARQQRRDRFQKLAMNGCVYTADFADDAILGTALGLANLTGDALFKALRAKIFRGLADHEMGHTMGLRHNFAGSTDALNYGKEYWNIRANVPAAKWAENSIGEHEYSTVMDYGARFNTDIEGLGRYDFAAIRFGYGQLMDIMPESADAANQLSNDLFFGDYKQIPALVSGDPKAPATPDAIDQTAIMRYSIAIANLQKGYRELATNGGAFGIFPERPYKFCSDEFEGNLDCKVWDKGADQKEIVNNVIDLYKNYYVFNGYQRGRLTWSVDSYLSRLSSRYFNRFSEAFQFYYFFGDAFFGSYLADDLLGAAMLSLNALGEVLQTPEPGLHCATDLSPDVLVVSSGYGPQTTCHNDAPQMTIAIPDGKPYYIDFSDDYYYRITRAGSLYEKLAALIALTSTQSRFFRVDSFADQDRYSINYYRLFKDQMINLLSGVIRNDPTVYGGYVSGGVYKPSPVVDPAVFGKATYPMPEYMLPTAKRVDTPVNKTIRFYALGLALAQLDSTWDSTLDFANYTNVTLKGSNDDVTYAAGTPVVEFADPQSHLVYRAAQIDPARPGIGVTLLQELNQIAGVAGTRGSLPKKYGTAGGEPLPDWNTAKADVNAAHAAATANTDAAKATALQTAYTRAVQIFNAVDYQYNYRIDLLGDIRTFRSAFKY
ncbi:MAG: zinc-dependent metalloprotease [Pseudomonadota bacterium]